MASKTPERRTEDMTKPAIGEAEKIIEELMQQRMYPLTLDGLAEAINRLSRPGL